MIKLDNTFRVTLPVQETWDLLTDLPRVAGCLPGAQLSDVVDGEYRGGLSAKIGPINARYQGSASFVEQDEVEHRAVINARGREEKGGGSASATITAVLLPDGDAATQVHVSTGLAISGRAAQFGRSLLAEVSSTMVDEFVRRLEAMISADEAGPQAAADEVARAEARAPSAPSAARATDPRGVDGAGVDRGNALDLGSVVILPMVRRAAVPLGAALLGTLVGVLVGRRSGSSTRRPIGYVLAQAADLPASPLPVYRRF